MVLDFQPLDMVLRSLLFLQQQKVLKPLYPQLEKSSVQVGLCSTSFRFLGRRLQIAHKLRSITSYTQLIADGPGINVNKTQMIESNCGPSRWSSCSANVFFLLSSPAYVSSPSLVRVLSCSLSSHDRNSLQNSRIGSTQIQDSCFNEDKETMAGKC